MRWLILALMLLVSFGPEPSPAQQPDPVTVKLIADSDSWKAGQSFRLGLLFEMPAGWHIYWRNPGELGLPTKISFLAPEGFKVGAQNWPAPERFLQVDDIPGYGYSRSVLVFATITPPAAAAAGAPQADLTAEADWLSCGPGICIPERKKFSLRMPSGGGKSINQDLFKSWEAKLPLPAPSAQSPLSADVKGALSNGRGDFAVTLKWTRAPKEIFWVPELDPALKVSGISINHSRERSEILFRIESDPAAGAVPDSLGSVVLYAGEDGVGRGVSLGIRLR